MLEQVVRSMEALSLSDSVFDDGKETPGAVDGIVTVLALVLGTAPWVGTGKKSEW